MYAASGWKSEDLIDFEYLLLADSEGDGMDGASHALHAFREDVLPSLQAQGTLTRASVFRAWLEVQRAQPGRQLPGEYWKSAWQTLVLLGAVLGTLLGGGLAAALLFYRGSVPVNVPWFLACTVGVQLLILALATCVWLIRAGTHWLEDFRPIRSLYSGLIWMLSTGVRKLRGEQRARLQVIWTRIARRRDVYGSLATWPFLVVIQNFGVWFNIGILVALLTQVSFKDIDFGWQSSFVESDELAYRLTAGVAAPWSWFAPHAHPTQVEVTESHFTYKHTRSNKAWWPFLCYAVACYGLLVRMLLLGFASVMWRQALARLTFDHEGCPALYRRLLGAPIHTHQTTRHGELTAYAARPVSSTVGNAILLYAADAELQPAILGSYASQKLGWKVLDILPAEVDHPNGNRDIWQTLAHRARELAGVVVVIPATRSPIVAIALFLQRVIEAIGAEREVVLLLVGKASGTSFQQIDPETLRYWQNFVVVNQLNVSLEAWSQI